MKKPSRKTPIPSRKRAVAARKPARRAATRRRVSEQPLGEGVGDAFALQRLNVPEQPLERRHARSGVREIGWAEFGTLAHQLASRISAEYAPDVVLGVAPAGVYVGGAVAPALRAELFHLHLPGRGAAERLPRLKGKKVLVIDDVTSSGRTLARATEAAERARAAEVRSAVLVLRPGGARPDWCAEETGDVVVFGWDYQFHGGSEGDPGDTGV